MVQVTKKYEHGATNEQVECELADKDLVGGEAFRMVQVKGLVQRFINQAAGYGKTMMFAPGAVLDVARNKLLIPAGSKVEVSHATQQWPRVRVGIRVTVRVRFGVRVRVRVKVMVTILVRIRVRSSSNIA